MTTGLISEMTNGVFQPLIRRLGEEGEKGKITADDVQELVSALDVVSAVLERAMEGYQRRLGGGVEKKKFIGIIGEFSRTFGVIQTALVPQVRELAERQSLPGEEKFPIRTSMSRFLQQAESVGEQLELWSGVLERPVPRVDLTKMIGPKPPADYEGYVDIEDVKP